MHILDYELKLYKTEVWNKGTCLISKIVCHDKNVNIYLLNKKTLNFLWSLISASSKASTTQYALLVIAQFQVQCDQHFPTFS